MLYVNGRFLTQPVSGVQRYARELLGAFDALLAARGEIAEVLVPHAVAVPAWRALRVRVVRGGHGHAWEQTSLAHAARHGQLVSLGNSGPLAHRDHVLCLHDANLFEIPAAFSPAYRAWHGFLRPRLARRAAHLLTVSRHSAQALGRHLRVDPARFTIVPNSAEHVLNWPVDAGAPARHGLEAGRYILSVGNQSPNKNLAALVQAHALAGSEVPPLVLVGGAVPGVTDARTAQDGRVRALGRVPDSDLRGLYEGAAGFVFPSLHEGFGIPPLEAMQLGVPVLCARAGAMPEVLGQAPMWFDPLDVRDMAQALNEFARLRPDQLRALQVMGRAIASQYRWRDSATKLCDVLENHAGVAPLAA